MINSFIYEFNAAYYLNPAFQYQGDVSVDNNLLETLRSVVSRLEENLNTASQALAEVIFNSCSY